MAAPILSTFKICGLHGYKDVEIDFTDSARILIAGNGSGKTTIFNALYSVLSCRFHRLASLEFESIICQFSSDAAPVVVTKRDLGEMPVDAFTRASQLAARVPGVGEEELVSFLQSEYVVGGIVDQASSDPLLNTVYIHTPGDYAVVGATLDEIALALRSGTSKEVSDAFVRVRSAMQNVQVLYLPTYRRIELPLLKNQKKAALSRPGAEDQVFAESSADTRHINFGLADVERRLNELSESVERQSNIEYRNISATILDEALADQIESSKSGEELPDIESLQRFLSRVAQGPMDFYWRLPTSVSKVSQEKNERRIEAIQNLYETGGISSERQRFLRYFLTRLGSVIAKTKATESMLQRFVEACNKYLRESTDEKIFTYDPNATRVKVINSWTEREIPLGHLSSGEKQVVSILARLYLYREDKFVLIDEPELSLSLDWQKRILPDMMSSGSVRQLFAITHSPFIFDNELDPFAGTMRTSRREVAGRARNGH